MTILAENANLPASHRGFRERCSRKKPKPGSRIDAFAQRPPPPFVIEIPLDRRRDTGVECFLGAPTEFRFDLAGINRIAPVVPRTVGDMRDQFSPRLFAGPKAIDDVANLLDDGDILHRCATTDIVGFTYAPVFEDQRQRLDVILDVKPIAHLPAIAINRQRPVLQGFNRTSGISFSGK